jgi:hypothetical protein
MKRLAPKCVSLVEDVLCAMEHLRTEFGDVSADGKAIEILNIVDECAARISDVLEA